MFARGDKGSVAFVIIIITVLVSFLFFVPLPHYHHESSWFMGPSLAARIMDNSVEAEPIDRVIATYVSSSLQSPFDISCVTDLDCNVINIKNQCKTYCADSADDNPEVIKSLEKQRVCDPAFWKPETTNCRCVFNKCLKLDY